jgi:hypothetical protein
MENQIEARIEVSGRSVTEVYFWQAGQRSESLHLYGPEDEYFVGESPVPESIFAWVTIKLPRKESEKNRIAWEVVYKTNVVDNDLQAALEEVKRKIETAIEKGTQARIVLDDDLRISEWEAVLSPAAESMQGSPRKSPAE